MYALFLFTTSLDTTCWLAVEYSWVEVIPPKHSACSSASGKGVTSESLNSNHCLLG
jgi:hypothetical protein